MSSSPSRSQICDSFVSHRLDESAFGGWPDEKIKNSPQSGSYIDPEKIQSTIYDNTREGGMMCGTAENRLLEWRATVEVRQNSKKKRVLHTNMSLLFCFLRHGILNLPPSC